MLDAAFCKDFLANFLSDLAVGAILGSILALWIGKRLGLFELAQQRKKEKRENLEKAIRYLELLRDEVETWLDVIPAYIVLINDDKGFLSVGTLWDVLQPGGELPKLLTPLMLRWLNSFYRVVNMARQMGTILLTARNQVPIESKRVISKGFENIPSTFSNLPERIESEIQRLQEELETL